MPQLPDLTPDRSLEVLLSAEAQGMRVLIEWSIRLGLWSRHLHLYPFVCVNAEPFDASPTETGRNTLRDWRAVSACTTLTLFPGICKIGGLLLSCPGAFAEPEAIIVVEPAAARRAGRHL
ncbi:hypothetical protein [Paracoccus sp. Ld10]|uniref:hypothetical protein n=1 Tax=Paracoccus sp. Ld10 TaxID=649158 RepID=UPI003870633C